MKRMYLKDLKMENSEDSNYQLKFPNLIKNHQGILHQIDDLKEAKKEENIDVCDH